MLKQILALLSIFSLDLESNKEIFPKCDSIILNKEYLLKNSLELFNYFFWQLFCFNKLEIQSSYEKNYSSIFTLSDPTKTEVNELLSYLSSDHRNIKTYSQDSNSFHNFSLIYGTEQSPNTKDILLNVPFNSRKILNN